MSANWWEGRNGNRVKDGGVVRSSPTPMIASIHLPLERNVENEKRFQSSGVDNAYVNVINKHQFHFFTGGRIRVPLLQ